MLRRSQPQFGEELKIEAQARVVFQSNEMCMVASYRKSDWKLKRRERINMKSYFGYC